MAPASWSCAALRRLPKIDGRSWVKLVRTGDPGWRTSWFYEYNYEKQFPYTPNVRGVRTDQWKYIHYPHGDGSADRHLAELYDLKTDPDERKNLIADPAQAPRLAELRAELDRLMRVTGLTPETNLMPLDEGIKQVLPDLNTPEGRCSLLAFRATTESSTDCAEVWNETRLSCVFIRVHLIHLRSLIGGASRSLRRSEFGRRAPARDSRHPENADEWDGRGCPQIEKSECQSADAGGQYTR